MGKAGGAKAGATLKRFLQHANNSKLMSNHKQRLQDLVLSKTLGDEISNAITYCLQLGCSDAKWKEPSCVSVAYVVPEAIVSGSQQQKAKVLFPGTLLMLDLKARVKPVEEADVARMCWAAERLDESGDVSKLLTGISVRAEYLADLTDEDGPEGRRHYVNLQRLERDAEIDVICLSVYWHKEHDGDEHPLRAACTDVVFSAELAGQGLDWEIERFKRKMDEEKQRQVWGLSAWRTACDLKRMVMTGESQRKTGQADGDLLAQLLASRPELASRHVPTVLVRCQQTRRSVP